MSNIAFDLLLRCMLQCCCPTYVGDVKDGLNYIVYHNSNYLNFEILQINALNYMKPRIEAWY